MRPRAANSLADNVLLENCRRGLHMDHPAEHEARPQRRDQADRSSQPDPRFAQFGYVPGRGVMIADSPHAPPGIPSDRARCWRHEPEDSVVQRDTGLGLWLALVLCSAPAGPDTPPS
jgi:hypothetical protein